MEVQLKQLLALAIPYCDGLSKLPIQPKLVPVR